LRTRYIDERQADKYRAELQIRRRKPRESLSELHHNIHALPYPKLKADAREELACRHFTNALDDPDFAVKVKERTPRTLNAAFRIVLRLEAWAKNVKQEKQEEDRTEIFKNEVRITAKPETTKSTQHTQHTESRPNDGLNKLETQMTQIHQELK